MDPAIVAGLGGAIAVGVGGALFNDSGPVLLLFATFLAGLRRALRARRPAARGGARGARCARRRRCEPLRYERSVRAFAR